MTTKTPTKNDLALLEQAVTALAGRCDGAEMRDEQGFNKPDSVAGRFLAVKVGQWSEHEAWRLWKMLHKYSKQLARYGIDYSQIAPPREVAAAAGDLNGRFVDYADGVFEFHFPYGDYEELKPQLGIFRGRRFDKNQLGEKCWFILASQAGLVQTFALDNDFTISQAAMTVIQAPPQTAEKAGRVVQVKDGHWKVTFEFAWPIVNALQDIRGAFFDKPGMFWTVPQSQTAALVALAEKFNLEMETPVTASPAPRPAASFPVHEQIRFMSKAERQQL